MAFKRLKKLNIEMTCYENKFWDYINNNLFLVLIILSTVISLFVRISMSDFISRDMSRFLLQWYDAIKIRGGFNALGTQVGNYNIPYQTLVAFLTYIPIKPIYAYKISSSIFDFIQGYVVYKIIFQISRDWFKASIGYAVTVNLPIVLLNSALWGQCDSIYTTFCLMSLYFMIREQYMFSWISMGAAFAFKLQAVLFLPFLLFVYANERKFSIIQIIWIPIIMIILSLGGGTSGAPD